MPGNKKSFTFTNLHEKIRRQKKLGSAQFAAMLDVYRHYQQGTFLSLDIVGSTKLKEGTDSVAVVDTFKAFHGYVNSFITGSVSNVFSGDGVMCLFRTPKEAVEAGLAVLRNLEAFNRKKSRLKRYLNIRVGINTGLILYGGKKDLGKYSERTIDIAGHFQKHAHPGQLLVSQATWAHLSNPGEFKRRWRKIDGTTVYEYKKIFYPPLVRAKGSRTLPPLEQARYWARRWFHLVRRLVRAWKLLAALGALGAVLGLAIGFNNVWYGDAFPVIKRNRAAIHGEVVNNKVRYARPWYHLGDAKIKTGDSWEYLPKTVYLIIPKGKNSLRNIRLGINEQEIIVLKRALDNRYRKAWGISGLYLRYVETFDDYYVFTRKKEAEDFLRKLIGEQ